MAGLREFSLGEITQHEKTTFVVIKHPRKLTDREIDMVYRRCLATGPITAFSEGHIDHRSSIYIHFENFEDAEKFTKKVVDYRPR